MNAECLRDDEATTTMGRRPTVYDAIAKIVHPENDEGDDDDGGGNPVFVA